MEGWPEGWTSWDEGSHGRYTSPGTRFVLYGEREGCRRAAWAIEGCEGVAVDREALAMALCGRLAEQPDGRIVEWDRVPVGTRAEWLQVADEAIRLRSFEPRVGGAELRARIEELERANAALTATTNAALERAKEAEDEWDEMLTRHTLDLAAALGYANGAHFGELLAIVGQRTAAMDERDNRIGRLIETAKAAEARAAEAEDLRAKNRRVRRALDAMARGVAHMADAVSEMVGGEEGAP